MAEAQAADEVDKIQLLDIKHAGDIDLTANEFKHETRGGLNFSTGNTKALTISGSSLTLYRVRRWEHNWKLGAYFNRVYSTTNPTTTTGTIAKYIFGTYRLDYYFLPRTTVYFGGGGYTDEIKGIDTAAQVFTGISHYFVKTDRYYFRGSGGYDFTYEDRVAPNPNQLIHSATAELEYWQKFNEIVAFLQTVKGWENIQHGYDFRLHSDTELKITMAKHLALVLGYHVRFDNRPVAAFKKTDTIADISVAVNF